MKTVVGLYDSVSKANQVKSALVSRGYDSSDIDVIDQSDNSGSSTSNYNTPASSHESVGARIKNFFGSLSGHDEESHRSYTEGVAGGGAMVAVNVDDNDAEEIADYLESQGARQIEGGYGDSYGEGSSSFGTADGTDRYGTGTGTLNAGNAGYAATGSSDYANTGRGNVTGEQVIPVVAEELEVGKRQVARGGVRVFSRVISEPVSESVNLHDERVVVDRRPVDRAATDADFNTRGGAIEVNATGEEAVVGKRSRVVEEVVVGKQATDRNEKISDTVRHTEVDVENTPAGSTTGATPGRNKDFNR